VARYSQETNLDYVHPFLGGFPDVGDVGDARKKGPPRRAAKPPDAR
jgi:hypothetical protein